MDEKVWAKTAALLTNPTAVLKRLQDQLSGDGAAKALELLEAAVRKQRTKQENLWAAIEDATTDAARKAVMTRLDIIATELEKAEMECRSLAAQTRAAENMYDSVDRFFKFFSSERDRLDTIDLDGKRTIMRQLDVKVWVTPKGVGESRWSGTIGIRPPRWQVGDPAPGYWSDNYAGDIYVGDSEDELPYDYEWEDGDEIDYATTLDKNKGFGDIGRIDGESAPRRNSQTRPADTWDYPAAWS